MKNDYDDDIINFKVNTKYVMIYDIFTFKINKYFYLFKFVINLFKIKK